MFLPYVLMPLVLSGQRCFIDNLSYHTSKPLASRIVGRSHLRELKLKDMERYIKHYLEIAGVKEQLF